VYVINVREKFKKTLKRAFYPIKVKTLKNNLKNVKNVFLKNNKNIYKRLWAEAQKVLDTIYY